MSRKNKKLSIAARHSALAYGGWLFLSVGGCLGLAVFFIWTMGIAGIFPTLGAAFGAFVAWFATQGNANGNSSGFQMWCLALVFGMGAISAFSGATAAQMMFERVARDQAFERNAERADKITQASVAAKKGGLRSQEAAEVGKQTASLLGKDAADDIRQIEAENSDPDWLKDFKRKWIRYVEWFNGLAGLVAMALLYTWYKEEEDRNRDGVPDFLQTEDEFPAELDAGK